MKNLKSQGKKAVKDLKKATREMEQHEKEEIKRGMYGKKKSKAKRR